MRELEPERGAVPDLSAVPLDQVETTAGLEAAIQRILPRVAPVPKPSFASSI